MLYGCDRIGCLILNEVGSYKRSWMIIEDLERVKCDAQAALVKLQSVCSDTMIRSKPTNRGPRGLMCNSSSIIVGRN
jgi:hypothetical protein